MALGLSCVRIHLSQKLKHLWGPEWGRVQTEGAGVFMLVHAVRGVARNNAARTKSLTLLVSQYEAPRLTAVAVLLRPFALRALRALRE